MDTDRLKQFVEAFWADSILPSITDYIRIPNKSPAFDPQWVEHGYMEDAVRLMEAWARRQLAAFPGASLEVVRLAGRTPLLFMDIPGDGNETVLLYGHLDKQPEMMGWSEGLGPWLPVLKDDKLYGRGGADDGYAIYACLAALLAMREQQVPRAPLRHPDRGLRGIRQLRPAALRRPSRRPHRQALACRLPRLRLRRLRAPVAHHLAARRRRRHAHGARADRGRAFGRCLGRRPLVLPHPARRCCRASRTRRPATIKLSELHVQIPPQRIEQAKEAARVLGNGVYARFPFAGATRPMADDTGELVLNRTWRPQLAVIGMDGYPAPGNAGNVLLPYSTAKLSLRLPPTLDARRAVQSVRQALEADAPYGAVVEFDAGEGGQSGWHAPPLAPWLEKAVAQASLQAFGKPAVHMGEGGTIPFMGMLGEKFPDTQFVITGVLGPHSNAHGPNEFLHLPTGRRVTLAVASLIAAHHAAST